MSIDYFLPSGDSEIIKAMDFGEVRRLAGALTVSEGVRRVTAEEVRDGFYRPGAIVPCAHWRQLDSAELLKLTEPSGVYRPLRHIGFAQLPDRVFSPLAAALKTLRYRRTLNEDVALLAPLIHSVEQYLLTTFGATETHVSQGLKSTAPGLLTTAIDRQGPGLAGLHMDAWDGASAARRIRARTRATVNVGPDVRHLLYVPITATAMQERCKELSGKPVEMSSAWEVYADHEQSVPILRLTLRPGDIYLAATDIMVHDGSTEDAAQRTFTIQVRSNFAAEPTQE